MEKERRRGGKGGKEGKERRRSKAAFDAEAAAELINSQNFKTSNPLYHILFSYLRKLKLVFGVHVQPILAQLSDSSVT